MAKKKTPERLINIHHFPLRAEGKEFPPGSPVAGINQKVIDSWYRRGVLGEPPKKRGKG